MGYKIKCLLTFLILAISLTSCDKESEFLPRSVDMLDVDRATGYSKINFSFARTHINNLPFEVLSHKEEQGLMFLREEEKVITDFYTTIRNTWDNLILENLGSSEKTHFNATVILVNKYSLIDPIDQFGVGEFPNAGMQAYYDYLISEGNKSVEDTYKMASLAGEANIVSLKNQLSRITNNQDFRLLYNNLMATSRNHLRITVNHFERLGGTYVPRILNEMDFREIMESGWDMEI